MPELPEVETIVQGLSPRLKGRSIADLYILNAGSVHNDDVWFQQQVLGAKITAVRRKGKLILVDLEGDRSLAFHLKMTGRVWLMPADIEPDRHTHIVFWLDSGEQFVFQDQRKFGFCALFSAQGLMQWDFYRTLGPDPLKIDSAGFLDRFSGRKGMIKPALMNQKIIAGVGNIYADESLFMAKIHPAQKISNISSARLSALHESLQKVLRKAIGCGGSSFRDYRDAFGEKGNFQDEFQVYGQKNSPCPECETPLIAEKIGGRTSTFCPQCQPLAGAKR